MLTTYEALKAWANPSMVDTRQAEVERCIVAASAFIASVAGRVVEKAAFTEYLDGSKALGKYRNLFYLPARYRMVEHPTGFTISENGVSLTSAVGYSNNAEVILTGANRDLTCTLTKRSGSWADGTQNIAVTFNAGYGSAAIPADVAQLANEMAWLFFNSPEWVGTAQKSSQGGSVTFDKELTQASRWVLQNLMART